MLRSLRKLARLDLILKAIPALAFNDAAAAVFAGIVAHAGYSRRILLARMIAAQALVHRSTMVAMNAADYQDIPNLTLLAW
jgi:predicted nucleic acid-binding protein